MELKGSKTEMNLLAAFAGESQARNRYTYFASKAKKEGYEQTGNNPCKKELAYRLFSENAVNDERHAGRDDDAESPHRGNDSRRKCPAVGKSVHFWDGNACKSRGCSG